MFDKIKDDDCLGTSLNNKPSVSLYAYPYRVYDNCLMREKETKDGAILEPICNFTAWATAEIIRDDGAEQKRELRIAGTKQDGTPLPSVTVEATELHRKDKQQKHRNVELWLVHLPRDEVEKERGQGGT